MDSFIKFLSFILFFLVLFYLIIVKCLLKEESAIFIKKQTKHFYFFNKFVLTIYKYKRY